MKERIVWYPLCNLQDESVTILLFWGNPSTSCVRQVLTLWRLFRGQGLELQMVFVPFLTPGALSGVRTFRQTRFILPRAWPGLRLISALGESWCSLSYLIPRIRPRTKKITCPRPSRRNNKSDEHTLPFKAASYHYYVLSNTLRIKAGIRSQVIR